MIKKGFQIELKKETIISLSFFGLLSIFTFLVYFKAISIPLISDDYVFVIDLSNWGIFGSTFFRPLLKLYFDILNPVFGMNPQGYHVLNLVIHIVNAFLIYLICKLIFSINGGPGNQQDQFNKNLIAACLALFLAANYSLSQAVFWISGVTTLAQSFFILTVIYTYSLFVLKRKKSFLIISLIFFFFGLGAKEGVFVMVGVIPLLYFSLECKRPDKKILLSWAYYWSIGLLYLLVASRVFAVSGRGTYKYKLGWTLFRNIQQFILSSLLGMPFNDSSLDSIQQNIVGVRKTGHVSRLDPWFAGAIVCYIILIVILIKGRKRTWAAFLAMCGAMLPSILPESHLSGWYYYPQPFRTYYTPAIFMILLLALFFVTLSLYKSRKATAAVVIILLGLSVFNGCRIFKKGDDWIEVSRRYKTIINNIRNKLDPDTVTTPRVLIKIVDGFWRRKVGRLFYKGVEVDYNISLIRIFREKIKAKFLIWAQRYKTKKKAYLSISEYVINKVRGKKLTLFIYADKKLTRVDLSKKQQRKKEKMK